MRAIVGRKFERVPSRKGGLARRSRKGVSQGMYGSRNKLTVCTKTRLENGVFDGNLSKGPVVSISAFL